jgi:hypothetical protein
MRIYKLLLAGVLGITLCLLFLTGVLYAQEPVKLKMIPGDEELNLVGPVGADTRFEDGFRLVARGGDLASITFDPSDLTDVTDDDNRIPFWKITVETAKPLSEDVEETFKLVVTGWDKPGTYSGQLRILKPKEPLTQGLTIPITLSAKAIPEVAKVPATAKLDPSLVRCGSGVGCWLAERVLGPASTQTTREIRLENTSLASALLQEFEVTDVKGATSGYQLTAEDFVFDVSDLDNRTLSSKESGVLSVTVKTSQIPPGEYKGTIRIPVQDQDTPVSIDVDVKVRGGLFVPIVFIVGGWLAGHVIKLYPTAEKRARLWGFYKRLKKTIKENNLNANFEKRLNLIEADLDQDKLDSAKEKLELLEKAVQEALSPRGFAAGAARSLGLDEQRAVRWSSALQKGVRTVLGWLSGIAPEAEALFILWIWRPLLYFGLVVSIIYLGLKQLYTANATFGANAFLDYVGLITWAMSADIVSRSIIPKPGQDE